MPTHNLTVENHLLQDDGTFPNHPELPLLIYRQVWGTPDQATAAVMEEAFQSHNWRNVWRNGIYSYHHYHSNTHEVLGIYQGQAKLQLGGPKGVTATVKAGDVLILPAGVAHKNLEASADFACVGAYPAGRSFDMNYGRDGERPQADQNIAQVPLPEQDPIYGLKGPLSKYWSHDAANKSEK